jgi:hypothetical protein
MSRAIFLENPRKAATTCVRVAKSREKRQNQVDQVLPSDDGLLELGQQLGTGGGAGVLRSTVTTKGLQATRAAGTAAVPLLTGTSAERARL